MGRESSETCFFRPFRALPALSWLPRARRPLSESAAEKPNLDKVWLFADAETCSFTVRPLTSPPAGGEANAKFACDPAAGADLKWVFCLEAERAFRLAHRSRGEKCGLTAQSRGREPGGPAARRVQLRPVLATGLTSGDGLPRLFYRGGIGFPWRRARSCRKHGMLPPVTGKSSQRRNRPGRRDESRRGKLRACATTGLDVATNGDTAGKNACATKESDSLTWREYWF